MYEVNCLVKVKNELGECPVWSYEDQLLWWIDSSIPTLFRYNPQTQSTDQWSMPKPIGSFALRSNGGLIFAFRKGLATMTSPTSPIEWLSWPSTAHPDTRFNDGKCDSLGRFWVGTMDRNLKDSIGAIFRVDKNLESMKIDDGFKISNGIAWSPDNKTMYFSDSPARTIYAYDFDLAAGIVTNRRIFSVFDDSPGNPDGCAVDSEGFVWSARVRAARVDRYDPDGNIERSIQLPVSRPTSLAFGGANMSTLFITTSTLSLTTEDLHKEPLAGSLFSVETGIKGLKQNSFSG